MSINAAFAVDKYRYYCRYLIHNAFFLDKDRYSLIHIFRIEDIEIYRFYFTAFVSR